MESMVSTTETSARGKHRGAEGIGAGHEIEEADPFLFCLEEESEVTGQSGRRFTDDVGAADDDRTAALLELLFHQFKALSTGRVHRESRRKGVIESEAGLSESLDCRPANGLFDERAEASLRLSGRNRKMIKFERQGNGPGIDHCHGRAVSIGLSHGESKHGRLMDRVCADGQEEVGLFNLSHGDGQGSVEP